MFIEGTENVRSSAILDHAKVRHAHSSNGSKMNAPSPLEYAPVAKAFIHEKLDPAVKERLVKKFEIAFFLAKEKLPFTKFIPLCEMEVKHGMQIGSGYKNDHACASFVNFITLDQLELLKTQLRELNFCQQGV